MSGLNQIDKMLQKIQTDGLTTPQEQQSSSGTNEIVDYAIDQIKAIRPATRSQCLKTDGDRLDYGSNLLAAFFEQGINRMDQVEAGLSVLRKEQSPFAPDVGSFARMCVNPDGLTAEQRAFNKRLQNGNKLLLDAPVADVETAREKFAAIRAGL